MPGGGLWLLGLARPLARLAEQGEPGKDALNAIVLSLKRPFIALAATTGLDSYDAYAQVKACQPNQFYSLRHLGLHGAAAEGSPTPISPAWGWMYGKAVSGICLPRALPKRPGRPLPYWN